MDYSDSYRREVTAKVESGWKIEEETPDRVTLVRREFGSPGIHLVIAILTIWWAMGVPNLLYAGYRYVTGSQRTVVWKDRPDADADDPVARTE
ncbi:hypothetical protein [Halogeometricum luteum]|uniref:DUF8108 domain-containing protein n=1 Tax=Halogeometricum luteum TaxID=2950537 RepID=A0ABU2G2H5_9EURY|nr:hypothetical protein [Halogeometricum sp. S3BR5-2]MDS0294987.1 hypothetical protein [Halogeometricum sp. S3BR5-2]